MKASTRATTAILVAFAALLVPQRRGTAQDVMIPRVDEPIHLDGRVDERAWDEVPVLPVTMFEPEFDGSITRSTAIRIAHDGEFLYAGGVFEDDGPVTADVLERDRDNNDDVFNLVLDTFHDRRTALWFAVTPAGTRLDGALTDDAEGDAWNHIEYDSFWDAEAVVRPGGWSAEMRIPLTSLRFEAEDGRVTMGLITGRKIARLWERHTFPAIQPGPSFAQFKPSLAATAVLRDVSEVRPRYLTPYATGGASGEPAAAGTAWDVRRELGGDLKVGLAQNLTLDVTVNTDFAQTEVDDEQINLTRFDLFFPEKRRFFLEQSGAFAFGDGREHRLFHSRRIGLGPDGELQRIHGGARLAGRLGAWEVGFLSMQTDAAAASSQNYGVARARRALGTGNSYLGGILTTRVLANGTLAAAGGVDGDLILTGSHHLAWSLAASGEREGGPGGDRLLGRVLLEDRDKEGTAYRVEAARIGSRYAPPIGFLLRRGSRFEAEVSRGRFGGSGYLQERLLGLRASARTSPLDGRVASADVELRSSGVRRGGGDGSVSVRLRHENLNRPFELSPAARVPAGTHRFVEGRLRLATSTARRVHASVDVTGGTFFDGRRVTATFAPTWTLSRHLEISGDVALSAVRFPDREQRYRAAILRFRVHAALNSRLTGNALVQYNSSTRTAGANMRLRYNFREGRDLHLVFLGVGADRAVASSSADWGWTRRSVQVKYAHSVPW